MGLTQTYRSQLAAKQNRWLLLYLGLAVAAHAGVATGLAVWHPLQPKQPSPTPIEFVDIEPDPAQLAGPPPEANRQAPTNSQAGGKHQPELSPQAAVPTPTKSNPQPPIKVDPRLDQPPVSVSPALSQSTPSTSVSPPPTAPSPASIAPQPAASPPLLSPQPLPQISPKPSTVTAAQPSGSTYSLSIDAQNRNSQIEDQTGLLNPDRTAPGTGVDAVQNQQWGTYLSGLNRAVDQQWQRVAVAATRRTKIQFRVDRQGRLSNLQVLQSSGDTLADRAAVEAVRSAAPFAPLPQDTSEDVLIVNFTFTQWLTPTSP